MSENQLQKKPPSIASVTVAYNGAGVLRQHLDALKRQTFGISEIILVNNASTDHTLNLLAEEYSDITVLNSAENTGVGGGLAAGIQYAAIQKKYDWVWLFDQDSVPAADALELLLSGLQHLNGDAARIGILAPVCTDPATKMTWPGLWWRDGRILKTPPNSKDPITLVDMVISSGSLLGREAVAAVGLPRADFFMDFVDFEHCLRLRRQGFAIAVVRDSRLDHVIGEPTTFNVLGRITYWTDHAPWRVYYMVRNEVFTVWQSYASWKSKCFVLYRLTRYALFLLLFGKRKLASLRMMYCGFLDGRMGKLGIRVSDFSS